MEKSTARTQPTNTGPLKTVLFDSLQGGIFLVSKASAKNRIERVANLIIEYLATNTSAVHDINFHITPAQVLGCVVLSHETVPSGTWRCRIFTNERVLTAKHSDCKRAVTKLYKQAIQFTQEISANCIKITSCSNDFSSYVVVFYLS